jgi:hypothetical protein
MAGWNQIPNKKKGHGQTKSKKADYILIMAQQSVHDYLLVQPGELAGWLCEVISLLPQRCLWRWRRGLLLIPSSSATAVV